MRFTNQVIEQLPPSQIEAQLKERIEQLENLLVIKEKALKKAPQGSLRVSKSHGSVQYYHKVDKAEKNGRYLDSEHLELAKALAQKNYNIKLQSVIQKELALLQTALTQMQKITQGSQVSLSVLEQINPDSRALVKPATLTDAQYAAAWLSPKYKGNPFKPEEQVLYTSNRERVRSKSEVLIADTLKRLGVPYRYEFPLVLKTGGRDQTDISTRSKKITVHPDFLCLNLRTRQEFIWEHFGRMGDSDYSKKTAQKLRTYSENNIHPGKNLIITVEAVGLPLSSMYIEEIIQTYLK